MQTLERYSPRIVVDILNMITKPKDPQRALTFGELHALYEEYGPQDNKPAPLDDILKVLENNSLVTLADGICIATEKGRVHLAFSEIDALQESMHKKRAADLGIGRLDLIAKRHGFQNFDNLWDVYNPRIK